MPSIIDVFLHLDKYINQVLNDYNTEAYILMFIVVFMETGFVITPFLPGDSLLFAIGAIAAEGGPINIPVIIVLLYIAAIGGDTVNYHIGMTLRKKVKKRQRIPLIKMEYIDRTQDFFVRYGRKTITIARFVPIIRTFAPFIAGVGEMSYKHFIGYNMIGGVLWVTALFSMGYFFGNIEFIKNHFSLVMIAIIVITVLPMVYGYIKSRAGKRKSV